MLLAEIGDFSLQGIAPEARWWNVYGPLEWTGEYVDHSSFEILSREMRSRHGISMPEIVPRQDSDSVAPNNILKVSNEVFGLLVADQIHPHMALVRKTDKAVHLGQLLGKANAWTQPWAGHDFADAETARNYCDNSSLVLLNTLRTACNNSALADNTDRIQNYSSDEATSIDTTLSFKEEERKQKETSQMQFRFRQHPSITRGPRVPKPHVESWLDRLTVGNPPDAGKGQSEPPDDIDSSGLSASIIRPTIFSRTPQIRRHSTSSSADERQPAKRAGR